MLNIKELAKQFREEYGPEVDEFELMLEEERRLREAAYAEVMADMLDAYMCESVEHFTNSRSRSIREDGRYFYSDSELLMFKEKYQAKGGDLEKLHIGKVYVDGNKFLCYEVCRKCYYERQSYYAAKIMRASKGSKEPLFYS